MAKSNIYLKALWSFYIILFEKNTLPNSDLTLKMKKSDFKQEKLNSKQKKLQDDEDGSDQ